MPQPEKAELHVHNCCYANLPQAFALKRLAQRTCEVQAASQPLGRLRPIPEPVLQAKVRDSLNFDPRIGAGADAFAALQRLVDERDPGYRR